MQYLYKQVVAVIADPEVKDRLEKEGSELLGSTPREFGMHINNEVKMWGKVIRDAGLTAS